MWLTFASGSSTPSEQNESMSLIGLKTSICTRIRSKKLSAPTYDESHVGSRGVTGARESGVTRAVVTSHRVGFFLEPSDSAAPADSQRERQLSRPRGARRHGRAHR